MINEQSIRAVAAARFNEHFGKPLYESYCFSQIPQTILHLLTGTGQPGLPADVLPTARSSHDKVILLYLDAFGWKFFERCWESYPFLRRFVEQGTVSKLTTQFPSTTSAHTTTIHTGLPVGESGVYEWFYYEPQLDRIIAPLLFSFAGDKARDTLASTGITPQMLYPQHTLYETLQQFGVNSTAFQHRDILPSPFSNTMLTGARAVPYKTLPEALINLTDAVLAENGKGYFFLYFDPIDTIGHLYGPDSRQFAAEIDVCMDVLEKHLFANLAGNLQDTLLLITADHGQMQTAPNTTIYLNQVMPSIVPMIKTNRDGLPLVPAGSARDLFLHIQPEYLSEAHSQLTTQLAGHAEVFLVRDLIEQGFFGPSSPSAQFLGRVGDLVILPYEHETVWWYEKGKFEQRNYGLHGGLSRDEMEIPLLALTD